jgi:hypothetical protein
VQDYWIEDVHFRVLAEGYPHEEQVCFWMWSERRPVMFPLSATLFIFAIYVVAGRPVAGRLGEGSGPGRRPEWKGWKDKKLTASTADRVRLVVTLTEAGRSLRYTRKVISQTAAQSRTRAHA